MAPSAEPLDTLVPDIDSTAMLTRTQATVDWASVVPSFTGVLSLRVDATGGGNALPHLEGNQDMVGAVLAAHYGFDAARVIALEPAAPGRRLGEANLALSPCPCLYHLTFEALGVPLASPVSLSDRLTAAFGPLGVEVLGAEAELTRVPAPAPVTSEQDVSQARWAFLLAGVALGCTCLIGLLVVALVWRRRAAAFDKGTVKEFTVAGWVADMDKTKNGTPTDVESIDSSSTCAPSDEVSSEVGSVTTAALEA